MKRCWGQVSSHGTRRLLVGSMSVSISIVWMYLAVHPASGVHIPFLNILDRFPVSALDLIVPSLLISLVLHPFAIGPSEETSR